MRLTVLLILFSFTLFGQRIKGVVLESKTKKPIELVNVYLKSTKQGAVTTKKGAFNFITNLKIKETDSIYFSSIGYVSKQISFSELKKENHIVYLDIKTENLNEIVLQSTNSLRTTIRFKKLTSMKLGVHSFGSKLIDNKIYVIGGNASFIEESIKRTLDEMSNMADPTFADFINKSRRNNSWEHYTDRLQIYNITNNTWATSPLKFRKRAYHNINYHDNKLYVLGGKRLATNKKFEYLDDKIEVFDLQSNKITIDHTNPHQSINFFSFVYDHNLIIIGGSNRLKKNGKVVTTKNIHLYDFNSGYWYQSTDMPKSKEVTGLLVNGILYLIGGYDNKPLSEIESYNLIKGKWKNEMTLFDPIEKPALTYHENIIYIFNDGKISTYNVVSKTLNEYTINLNLKASKLHYYKDNLYLIGGYRKYEFSKERSSGTYSIQIDEFSKTKINKSKSAEF